MKYNIITKSDSRIMRIPESVKSKPANKSFTLIELLVVIAIISILMTMLLPALGKAKDTAQKIACLNNMKQLAIPLQTYQSDFDGYPMLYLTSSNQKTPFFRMVELGYINSPMTNLTPSKEEIAPILQCPSDQIARKSDWVKMSYGFNGVNEVLGGSESSCVMLKNVPAPSQTLVFGEAWNYNCRALHGGRLLWKYHIRLTSADRDLNYNIGIGTEEDYYSLDLHGKNRQNYIFFDGHADTMDFWQTIQPGYYDSEAISVWGRKGAGSRNMWELDGVN